MLRRPGAAIVSQTLAVLAEMALMPPEKAGGATDTLNLHLYHVMEDAHYKNLPPHGNGGPPVGSGRWPSPCIPRPCRR